jgi:hypothetical protein
LIYLAAVGEYFKLGEKRAYLEWNFNSAPDDMVKKLCNKTRVK